MKTIIEVIWEIIKVSERIAILEKELSQSQMISCNAQTEEIRNREIEDKKERIKVLKAKRATLIWLFDEGDIKDNEHL